MLPPLLFNHAPSIFVVAQSGEFRVPKMIALRPLQGFDLSDDSGPNPNTLLHVISSQPFAPT
jgi:hypothetical protein